MRRIIRRYFVTVTILGAIDDSCRHTDASLSNHYLPFYASFLAYSHAYDFSTFHANGAMQFNAARVSIMRASPATRTWMTMRATHALAILLPK